jgi:hypothetical protein
MPATSSVRSLAIRTVPGRSSRISPR